MTWSPRMCGTSFKAATDTDLYCRGKFGKVVRRLGGRGLASSVPAGVVSFPVEGGLGHPSVDVSTLRSTILLDQNILCSKAISADLDLQTEVSFQFAAWRRCGSKLNETVRLDCW